jgi:hypothetical protein
LQQGPCAMQTNLDGSLRTPERNRGFSDVHLFDVSEQHDVTVNLRKAFNCLAQNGAQFLTLQGLGRHFAPTGEEPPACSRRPGRL